MSLRMRVRGVAGLLLLTWAIFPSAVSATQSHGDPEGLLVHQMSHIFFIFSMGLFVYWLRARKLVRQAGWRYIRYSAILFMFWTADAFLAHMLDEQYAWIRVTRVDRWHLQIDAAHPFIAAFYYVVKLDHLWCAPAMVCLYVGLKKLYRSYQPDPEAFREEAT